MTVLLEERRTAPIRPARSEGTRSAVLVDTQPILLEILEHLLERVGVATVAKATTAEDALDAVREQRPDLLLLGLRDADEVELIREARGLVPELKTLVLANTGDQAALSAAFGAGATIAISRSAAPEDIAVGVRQAFAPSIYLAPAPRDAAPTPARVDDGGLTKREREILQLVAEGYSNGRVARILWVTEQTVKFHLSNIYRKLDVANRTEASRWAQRNGLLADAPAEAAVA
jgi:DNA-binding NarL/FixJ family response regulator